MADPTTTGAGTLDTPAPSTPAAAPNAEIMRIQNDRALTSFSTPFESAASLRHFNEVAKFFADSIFVPDHFKRKPGDCLVAINLAMRMDEDPLQVMQNTFVVGGRPGFYTSFMIARANRRAGFKSKIRWDVQALTPAVLESSGAKFPNIRVTASAVDAFGESIDASVDTSMAIAEGWTKNAKYRSMCEHMLKWRAAAFLIRLYAPEVMMGMPTVEEVETMPPPVVTIEPSAGGVAGLESRLLSSNPLSYGALDAVAIPGNPEGEPETGQAPPLPAEGETLSAEQVEQVRKLAASAKVSFEAVEEAFDGPLGEYREPGKTALDILADANRVITGLVEKAKAAEVPAQGESLFDAPPAAAPKASKK